MLAAPLDNIFDKKKPNPLPTVVENSQVSQPQIGVVS